MKNAYKFAIALLACAGAYGQNTVTNSYSQINLVSDGAVSGTTTDTHLKNPWGLSRSAGSYWWASDANTGVSTLYSGSGQVQSLVVTIPTATGTGTGSPTGTVADGSSFVFDTLDGTISQWTGGTSAVIKINNHSKGAVYTGLTLATNGTVKTLYAANTVGGIEAYNASTFAPISLGTGAFVYPSLPSGYTPYGIQAVGAQIYVTYTSGAGTGNGVVGIFNTAGTFKAKLVPGKYMNEPWGIAKAPSNFGAFSGDILVGMTGSGVIAAFSPTTGQFLGVLKTSTGATIANPGLWAIYFGGGSTLNGPTNWLYFNAGINGFADGLFGYFISND
jgi:uncharacterized protein (TIGR03118 family)